MEKIFWIDNFEGEAQGGVFVRSEIGQFIKEMEEKGYKVVGIKFNESRNAEIIAVFPEIKKEDLK